MKYEIQFIAIPEHENWQQHSETYLLVYAREIAEMLLKNGKHKIRINTVIEKTTLGEIMVNN